MNDYQSRLDALRSQLKKHRLDAFIIKHGDTWKKENLEPHHKRLKFLCGLDASAGYIVVTQTDATVMIDGRYTESANKIIDQSCYQITHYTDIKPEQWAIDHIKKGQVIGYDSWHISSAEAKRMQKYCNDAGMILQSISHENPVDIIWNAEGNRPSPLQYIAIQHDWEYAGQTVEDKLTSVSQATQENNADSLIITADDSLAWLLNLRTTQNSQNPGLRGFGILQCEQKKLTVFTDVDCTAYDGSQTHDFEVDFLELEEFSMVIAYFERQDQTIQISPDAPDWFTEHLNSPASDVIKHDDPCEILKACKNKIEQQGIRNSQARDAIAIQNTIDWVKSSSGMTEQDVATRLTSERQKQNMFQGVSFDPIAGWAENGAKIHGHPTDTVISTDNFLLIDSGGQYLDGTTDITRTIAIGRVTNQMKHDYTIVLKAHIALATAIFPAGTTGAQLDALARAPLWQAGMDYAHGTGHGIGYFLNVHEGPCNISPRGTVSLKPGMFLSNEPGFYKPGHYGIRLENSILVQPYQPADHPDNRTGKDLLCFETMTKIKFDEDAIDRNLLSPHEIKWLDDYQAACF